jgi:peptidoglycan/LPS O-acetylase OafA/YrhL
VNRTDRIPSLDGVRGIAIIVVFLYHATQLAGISTLRLAMGWGWMGVDLFFVLSGYLITGILFDAREDASYYRAFYGKRVLRILPAYAFYLAVLMWVQWNQFRGTQGWYVSNLSNVLFWLRGWTVAPRGAEHLWSLAVEEQFYFVWPFVIARCRRPRTGLYVALGVALGSALLRALVVWQDTGNAWETAYLLTPLRADGLAWGAFLAMLQRCRPTRFTVRDAASLLSFLGAIGLVVVLTSLRKASWQPPFMQLLGYPAIAMLGGGLVGFAVLAPNSLLGAAPLRIAGKYSYAGYLWHPFALYAVQRWTQLQGLSLIGAGLVATAIPVLVSWYAVERPALRAKRFFSERAERPELPAAA